MRQSIAVAAVTFLSGLLGLAGSAGAAQTPKIGGILNFAVVASPPSYDCHAETTFALIHPVAPHYSLLLKIDAANYPNVTGDLAESWTQSPDGTAYSFRLHRGVKFHDGSPLTAADVKASYERIIRPPAGVVSVRRSYYEDFGEVETPDEQTVVFKMKAPVAGVLELLASPFKLHLQRRATAAERQLSRTRDHGIGGVPICRACAGVTLGGQALRRLLRDGTALPGRL